MQVHARIRPRSTEASAPQVLSLHMWSHYTHQIILVLSQYLHAYWILYN